MDTATSSTQPGAFICLCFFSRKGYKQPGWHWTHYGAKEDLASRLSSLYLPNLKIIGRHRCRVQLGHVRDSLTWFPAPEQSQQGVSLQVSTFPEGERLVCLTVCIFSQSSFEECPLPRYWFHDNQRQNESGRQGHVYVSAKWWNTVTLRTPLRLWDRMLKTWVQKYIISQLRKI